MRVAVAGRHTVHSTPPHRPPCTRTGTGFPTWRRWPGPRCYAPGGPRPGGRTTAPPQRAFLARTTLPRPRAPILGRTPPFATARPQSLGDLLLLDSSGFVAIGTEVGRVGRPDMVLAPV